MYRLDEAIADIERHYDRVAAAGIVPLTAGGDHSITLPIMRALARARGGPLGLVHFDAHCDTGPELFGHKHHHGGPFKVAVEDGALDPKRTIQIGIRGPAEPLWAFSYESGMTVVHIEDLYAMGIAAVVEKAREVAGDGPVYLSFDVDGLDPVYAPAPGTPEVGGFTTYEAQQMLRGLRGLDIVAGDVVEVSPPFDPSGTTGMTGAQMMFEILCLLAETVGRRKERLIPELSGWYARGPAEPRSSHGMTLGVIERCRPATPGPGALARAPWRDQPRGTRWRDCYARGTPGGGRSVANEQTPRARALGAISCRFRRRSLAEAA